MALPLMEEGKLLVDALNTVKIQVQQMKRHLELDQLMDALKSASLMLAELRTSSLSPKQYYELYMAVFDALRHLSNYLYDMHTQARHHLADLYELVQYAGNIIPRFYLMITVGAVYMSVPEAPVKEIMKDMMAMSRGVLHPIRGLFLRHYLSGQTRDHLPVGVDNGPAGNLQDSISFVLTNFIEMNKLWVRLQHQGHSRDREKREMERRELRILVGTNLVRLSQLDGVDLDMYQRTILPSILEQVVNCKDVIAQEYLMEVVIQVFTDEYHLYSLGPFLSATAQLHPKVNIKQIVIALIDRLAAYAAREAENEQASRSHPESEQPPTEDGMDGTTVADEVSTNGSVENRAACSVVELIKARPDLSIQDITALFVSLTNLSLSCYPDRLEYVDQSASLMLTRGLRKFLQPDRTPSNNLESRCTSRCTINSYPSVLTLLAIPNYAPLLAKQFFFPRAPIAHSIISSVLKNETIVETPEDVDGVWSYVMCSSKTSRTRHLAGRDKADAGYLFEYYRNWHAKGRSARR
ncbi:vacuolar protein sorting-associated protein 35 [Mycena latifolia]|nr:vacuolar protein sorting-associated protein 35 [Mycena latifolia]